MNMANLLKYKGYHGTVEFSSEDGMLVGYVTNIRDSLNYHGSSIGEITQAFHDSIDNYLDFCAEIGRDPDKEYKGSFNVRISPELHRSAAMAAEESNVTLNQFVQEAIEEKLSPKRGITEITIISPVQLQTSSDKSFPDFAGAYRNPIEVTPKYMEDITWQKNIALN